MRKLLSAILVFMMMVTTIPAMAEQGMWQKGDTGDEVRSIQERLVELGYEVTVNGNFDDLTEDAVSGFQRWNDLLVTGIVDKTTYSILFSEDAKSPVTYNEQYDVYEDAGAYDGMSYSWSDGMPATNSGGGIFMGVVSSYGASVEMPASKMMYAPQEAEWNINEYSYVSENGFHFASVNPLSTFAADVDTASYAQIRALILAGMEVPADAVRVEEMLNYFSYDYAEPQNEEPFGVSMELADCPWNKDALLLQIGVQAEKIKDEDRPRHNLVFLIDVSGSMFGSDRLDLVKRAFQLMLDELAPTDTVSIVTYASSDRVVLDGVPAADKTRIMEAISDLRASGSTNSAAGIQTAYTLAEKHAVDGGVNRILMATDGDFNVGMTSEGDLARLVMEKKKSGIRLTMLGVGYGNYKDNKLEALADYGDGNYYYLDSIFEARRALVAEAGGTLIEVAKDVKFQVDFNPAKVQAYRLVGYEDRLMSAADFADDTKDGGELGSGHRMTALYEIIPVGVEMSGAPTSRYQKENANETDEWLTVNIRAKTPEADESKLYEYPLVCEPVENMSSNMRFASAVAETAMLLRDSEWKGASSYSDALALARDSASGDPYKEEFVYMLTLLDRSASLETK